MNAERPVINAFIGKIIPKNEATDGSAEARNVPEYEDVLKRLHIPETTELNENILTPRRLKTVRFNETRPIGFSMKQVTKFHAQVSASIQQYIRIIESRDRDVNRLATEVDKYIVDLQNLQNQLAVYEAVGGVPLKDEKGQLVSKKNLSSSEAHMAAVKEENAELQNTVITLRATVKQLRDLLENGDENSDIEDTLNSERQKVQELQREVVTLRTRVRELETQLFGRSGYEIVSKDNGAQEEPKVKRPTVDLYEQEEDNPSSDMIQDRDDSTITVDRAAYEAERARIQEWTTTVTNSFNEVEGQLEEATIALDEALAAVADRDAIIADLQEKLGLSEEENAQLRADLEEALSGSGALNGDLADARDREVELHAVIASLESSAQNQQNKVSELTDELESKNTELAEVRAQNDQLTLQINTMRSILLGGTVPAVAPVVSDESETSSLSAEKDVDADPVDTITDADLADADENVTEDSGVDHEDEETVQEYSETVEAADGSADIDKTPDTDTDVHGEADEEDVAYNQDITAVDHEVFEDSVEDDLNDDDQTADDDSVVLDVDDDQTADDTLVDGVEDDWSDDGETWDKATETFDTLDSERENDVSEERAFTSEEIDSDTTSVNHESDVSIIPADGSPQDEDSDVSITPALEVEEDVESLVSDADGFEEQSWDDGDDDDNSLEEPWDEDEDDEDDMLSTPAPVSSYDDEDDEDDMFSAPVAVSYDDDDDDDVQDLAYIDEDNDEDDTVSGEEDGEYDNFSDEDRSSVESQDALSSEDVQEDIQTDYDSSTEHAELNTEEPKSEDPFGQLDIASLYSGGELDENLIDLENMRFDVDDDSRYDSRYIQPGDDDFLADNGAAVEEESIPYNGLILPPGVKPEDLF